MPDIVLSHDGTPIAYERIGEGPALVLVDGALCHRGFGANPRLAALLAEHFTVYTYDRRGRGDSGDTAPYVVEREVEDLAAVIAAAGGSAAVYGISSGAALAIEAARRGVPITRLALYEAPFIVDDSRPPVPPDTVPAVRAMLDAGRRGEAVAHFLRLVGTPRAFVALMRVLPPWRKLKAVAHTLPYDLLIVGDNQVGAPLEAERWAQIAAPALVLDGGKSPEWMRNAARAIAGALPAATGRTLAGQTHIVNPKVLAPVLAEFLGAAGDDEAARYPRPLAAGSAAGN